jgi:signal peptidase I
MEQNGRKQKSQVREWTEAIVVALVIALFIRTFVIQAFKIPSSSMVPTLQVGDQILVWKFIYGIKVPMMDKKLFLRSPERGDIVVFIYPGDPSKDYIKRVVGLPGEKIEIVGKQILINDHPIEDQWGDYTIDSTKGESIGDRFGPKTIPPNSLFVMGDNRNNSHDSRFWGYVDVNSVKGEAFVIYFSWDRTARSLLGKIRWRRLGHLIR